MTDTIITEPNVYDMMFVQGKEQIWLKYIRYSPKFDILLGYKNAYWGFPSFLYNRIPLNCNENTYNEEMYNFYREIEKIYINSSGLKAKIYYREFFEGFVKLACNEIVPGLPESTMWGFYEILDGNSGKQGQAIPQHRQAS